MLFYEVARLIAITFLSSRAICPHSARLITTLLFSGRATCSYSARLISITLSSSRIIHIKNTRLSVFFLLPVGFLTNSSIKFLRSKFHHQHILVPTRVHIIIATYTVCARIVPAIPFPSYHCTT